MNLLDEANLAVFLVVPRRASKLVLTLNEYPSTHLVYMDLSEVSTVVNRQKRSGHLAFCGHRSSSFAWHFLRLWSCNLTIPCYHIFCTDCLSMDLTMKGSLSPNNTRNRKKSRAGLLWSCVTVNIRNLRYSLTQFSRGFLDFTKLLHWSPLFRNWCRLL